jgi:hypothetical protein
MRITLRPAIRTHDRDAWAEILDEMPPSASNGEEVDVVANIAKDLQCCVVLEE